MTSGRQTTVRLAAADPSGKVAHADLLDGKDSTEFLEATAKAGDSDLLDGIDSTGLGGFLTGRINLLTSDGLRFGRPSGTSPALMSPAAAAHLSPTSTSKPAT